MEWTRAKRYTPYAKWSAGKLLSLQSEAANSSYQMRYHIRPLSGLLNDPNGFSYFNGNYHVFYQSFPFGAVHGLKSWVHMQSSDLVHWGNRGLAIAPGTDPKSYDNAGAYSGSAMAIDDRLFLMYTGNHRTPDWVRIPYQCGAWMDKSGKVTKLDHYLFKNPAQFSEHFRDPQIMKHNGSYYCLLGAQEKDNKTGHLDLWKSADLKDWQEVGTVDFGVKNAGYMIECPNLVFVDGKAVLVFCPQGLDKKIADYDNVYPNMYVVGDSFDFEHAKLVNPSPLKNLDDGFDVYASQCFNAPDGTPYVISWVGLPDSTYPTDDEEWANCLSQAKRLKMVHGELTQEPVEAMKSLRLEDQAVKTANQQGIQAQTGNQYELLVDINANQHGSLQLAVGDGQHHLDLNFDTAAGKLVVDRGQSGAAVNPKYGTQRMVSLPAGRDLKLHVFVDHSLCEIFVNDGQSVITLRFFAPEGNTAVQFDNDNVKYQAQYWPLQEM